MNSLLETLGTIIENNIWIAPLISLLAGILTSLTPCSLSSIPLVIGYVSGNKTDDTKKAFKLSIVFSLGTAITFTTLGIVASTLGKMIRLTGTYWFIILSIILIIMVLELWEITHIIPQSNFLNKNKKRGYIGSLIAGILAGLISSPCSTPVLIVILTIVGKKGSLIWGTILLLLYSIGHSFLTIISGTSIGFVSKINESKKYKKISKILKVIMGIVILLLAFYFFYQGI